MPVLVLQKGHCYRSSGSTGTHGEQDYATAVAESAMRLLHGRGGWQVRPILADDPDGAYKGDAFAAVHCDGSTDPNAHGASVGYRTEGTRWQEGHAFGQAFKAAYQQLGWVGFRSDNYTDALHHYYGTGEARGQGNYRAIIIECGFMTNPNDRAAMTGPGGADRAARAIGAALGIPMEGDDMDATQDQRLKDIHTWLPALMHRDTEVGGGDIETNWRLEEIEQHLRALLGMKPVSPFDPNDGRPLGSTVPVVPAGEVPPLVQVILDIRTELDALRSAVDALRSQR